MNTLANVIDSLSNKITALASLFVPLLVIISSAEAVARYGFNSPMPWSYDLLYFTYSAIFMLGCAGTLSIGNHVRTDYIWKDWSIKNKAKVDITLYTLIFLPIVIILIYVSGVATYTAFDLGEKSGNTVWQPVVWPFFALAPICFLLLAIQIVAEIIKCWLMITQGFNFYPEHAEDL